MKSRSRINSLCWLARPINCLWLIAYSNWLRHRAVLLAIARGFLVIIIAALILKLLRSRRQLQWVWGSRFCVWLRNAAMFLCAPKWDLSGPVSCAAALDSPAGLKQRNGKGMDKERVARGEGRQRKQREGYHCLYHTYELFDNSLGRETSTKGTMDPEGSARNSCNSWPLYACWADQRACFG